MKQKMTIEQYKETKKKINDVKTKTAEERAQFLKARNDEIKSPIVNEPAKLKIISKPKKQKKNEIKKKWYKTMPFRIGIGILVSYVILKILKRSRDDE